MKKENKSILSLLSEELDKNKLMNFIGARNETIISTKPHDLVTPMSKSFPYDDDEPEE